MEEGASHLFVLEPSPDKDAGYTCQTYFSHYLAKNWFKDEYFVYFSKEMNPIGNGESANPLIIYRWFDEAIKRNDHNHPKILHHRTMLQWVIDRGMREGIIDELLASRLAKAVANVPITLFRPEIWRLDLSVTLEGVFKVSDMY